MDFGCDYMDVEGLEQQRRCAVDVGCGWQLHGWNDDIGCGWQLRGWNNNVGVQYVDLGVAGRTGPTLMPAWVLEQPISFNLCIS